MYSLRKEQTSAGDAFSARRTFSGRLKQSVLRPLKLDQRRAGCTLPVTAKRSVRAKAAYVTAIRENNNTRPVRIFCAQLTAQETSVPAKSGYRGTEQRAPFYCSMERSQGRDRNPATVGSQARLFLHSHRAPLRASFGASVVPMASKGMAAAAASPSQNTTTRKIPRDAAVVMNVLRSMVSGGRRTKEKEGVAAPCSSFDFLLKVLPSSRAGLLLFSRLVLSSSLISSILLPCVQRGVKEWEPRVVNQLMEFVHSAFPDGAIFPTEPAARCTLHAFFSIFLIVFF